MKTTTAGTAVRERLLTTCCRAGFTKMVNFEEVVMTAQEGRVPEVQIGKGWKWMPKQTCAACGKDCEVAMLTPKEK